MRRLLNTLYVTSEGAWLAKDGQNIVVSVEGAERGRFPVHGLGSVVCLGRVGASPQAMAFCADEGVALAFMTENGRFLARVEGPVSGNVLLRREQYRRSDDAGSCARIVRSLVIGKALNQRAVVRRGLRDHGDKLTPEAGEHLRRVEMKLTDIARRAEKPGDTDHLRGLEGEAANAYFGVFDHLVRHEDAAFRFRGRSRRPPLDPLNALLSFVYTLLVHDVRAGCEGVGLDPAVGFLHRDRPGRPSLALDLVEELRPPFADRLVLSLVNRRQVDPAGFRRMENGACLMGDDLRKAVLVAYQERKREELRHPYLDETAPVGLLPHLQAQLLARHLRGDIDGYPPFVWK